ncbi:hypothetical protein SKAU_G00116550 [Synaphobranchus kaupii]|uniref:phosphatidyl-N-methylethanolamine N-methyltransferase n=1 Tax=Synaphobranchus kaupii TaxID=118154 RepID=A0A9Q1J105_SYNKA|nr:hypothetical protein SKAU_G00116550 [Synaphobranchus kaupii]
MRRADVTDDVAAVVCWFPGDYFGILMEQKVTGFPFNVMENPMYWGSTANYLGHALIVSVFVHHDEPIGPLSKLRPTGSKRARHRKLNLTSGEELELCARESADRPEKTQNERVKSAQNYLEGVSHNALFCVPDSLRAMSHDSRRHVC